MYLGPNGGPKPDLQPCPPKNKHRDRTLEKNPSGANQPDCPFSQAGLLGWGFLSSETAALEQNIVFVLFC